LKTEATALQVIHSHLRINTQFLAAEEQALKAMIRREVRRLKGEGSTQARIGRSTASCDINDGSSNKSFDQGSDDQHQTNA
jgi:hypothetical protein